LRILILAAGFIVLVALSHPGPWAVVAVAATVVLLLLLLEWIANRGSAPPPATVARPSAGAGPA
jgi:O-antigen/teichoic acid export membrane protein